MARITAYIEIDDEELDRFLDDKDFEGSLRARLDEVYDGDGNPVYPRLVGIDVEDD